MYSARELCCFDRYCSLATVLTARSAPSSCHRFRLLLKRWTITGCRRAPTSRYHISLPGTLYMKYEGALQMRIRKRLEQVIEMAELLGLLVIGIGTALAMGHLIWTMARADAVTLTDMLLM